MTLPGDEVLFREDKCDPPQDNLIDIHYIEKILQHSEEILLLNNEVMTLFKLSDFYANVLDQHVEIMKGMSDTIKAIEKYMFDERREMMTNEAIDKRLRKLEARMDHLETWMEIPEEHKLKDE